MSDKLTHRDLDQSFLQFVANCQKGFLLNRNDKLKFVGL